MNFPENGDVTASQHLDILLKAEEMWTNSQLMTAYTPHADAAIAVLNNQTATFEALTDKNKDNKVKVTWINPCGVQTAPAAPRCDIDGQELSTGVNEYEYNLRRSTEGLKINRNDFRTNIYDYNEFVAKGLLLHVKALDEWWAQQALIKLHAYAGVNAAVAAGGRPAAGYTYATGTGITTIPASAYGVGIVAAMMQQAIMNQMPGAYLIDNGLLYQPILNAKLNTPNADDKGLAARADMLFGRLTEDMFNFGAAGITEDLFAINPGAVAMKTRARFTRAPEVLTGQVQQTRFSIPSRVLPGVEYDVVYTLKCIENAVTQREEIVDVWNFETEGMIAKNPEGCPVTVGGTEYTPTGVLAYKFAA
jgi:hypothetical protein